MRSRGNRTLDRYIKNALGSIKLETLFYLQDGVCAYDGEPIYLMESENTRKNRRATIDHVRPKSKGGTYSPKNLVAASSEKNLKKGNLDPRGDWKPNFRHSCKEYRHAKFQVLRRRSSISNTILMGIRNGELPRDLMDNPISLYRVIRREYARLLQDPPVLWEAVAAARVAAVQGCAAEVQSDKNQQPGRRPKSDSRRDQSSEAYRKAASSDRFEEHFDQLQYDLQTA